MIHFWNETYGPETRGGASTSPEDFPSHTIHVELATAAGRSCGRGYAQFSAGHPQGWRGGRLASPLGGTCHLLAEDANAASYVYVAAPSSRSELGRPTLKAARLTSDKTVKPGAQAIRIWKLLTQKQAAVSRKLTQITGALEYGPEANALEQALCDLGAI